ncbi:FAD-dependent oxidoreductase [Malaciobacter molluscorum LMG 25693]|uniref:FAD-dependent oxidoreductase n=1 Tax=Malaciobacter molluscorum LMG 25693 TaxID=870501 RepID=A0A2G1DIB9_9BACT|nr:FAD-dependent oxidoreductase [Malaciobacter molluscorum]AXX91826.1 FAD-dependent oxidoreductase [Malaciobacter molluscorum LMG 25693]PHO18235.1 FAD-dependent oxidoreductase [Malaciobacter molluscorum LMG 25693]
MKKDIVIIGGGIVGLNCAYFLQKAGRQVTIIDENDITNSTSFGNAGLLSSYDKTPLSYPGVVTNTLKLMLKGQSPVILHPTTDLKIYNWLTKFILSANEKRCKKTMMLFEKFGEISLQFYEKMIKEDNLDFDYHRDGMLSVFTEDKSYEDKLKKYNISDDDRFEILNHLQIKEYVPTITSKAKGAILFKKNAHFDSRRVMSELKRHLEEIGVEFILNERVEQLDIKNDKIKYIITSSGNLYKAEHTIMSTGYQTLLARQCNKELVMTPAKGYSITFDMPIELKPKTSTLFNDLFIVMTPRRDNVRLTSKLEIGSTDPKVIQKQIDSIKNNFFAYNESFDMKNEVTWTGFRPLTPNDIPLIGKDEKISNLTYAMGLGWLGMTFAPAIGSIISDLVANDKTNAQSDGILMFSGFYQ